MQNPTHLQLLLNDFVVSRSSLHEFETCKEYIFCHRINSFLNIKMGKWPRDEKYVFGKKINKVQRYDNIVLNTS